MASNEIMFYRQTLQIFVSQLPQLTTFIIPLDNICSQKRSIIVKVAFIFQTEFAEQNNVI